MGFDVFWRVEFGCDVVLWVGCGLMVVSVRDLVVYCISRVDAFYLVWALGCALVGLFC